MFSIMINWRNFFLFFEGGECVTYQDFKSKFRFCIEPLLSVLALTYDLGLDYDLHKSCFPWRFRSIEILFYILVSINCWCPYPSTSLINIDIYENIFIKFCKIILTFHREHYVHELKTRHWRSDECWPNRSKVFTWSDVFSCRSYSFLNKVSYFIS